MTSGDVKKAANDISASVDEAAGSARSSATATASTIRDNASEYAARVGDRASDMYAAAQDRVRGAARDLPGTASDAVAAGQRMYERSSDTVAKRVSKQPIEALLLAAAIGYLVGWATNRS